MGEVFLRFGEAVGDGVGVDFLAVRFRCFRVGVGVGVAVRNFLIFVPNDSSALLGAGAAPNNTAAINTVRNTVLELIELQGVSVKRQFPRRLTQTPYSSDRRI